MRPPLFSGGNTSEDPRAKPAVVASMRPPLFSGGNKRAQWDELAGVTLQ